jgi:alkanesulfonate monooxygenase SsuD/methylene tetrahydromethanopterin reductase-like flavin-dependent oxidoreductase (luciferase family)
MAKRAVYLPPFDVLSDAAVVAELAVEVERAGWDGLFLWDHVTYSEPVEAIADPWICLAAAAVATERIALGPMVTPLARRRPQVLARQAVTLDRLAGGRLVLGFGLGDDGGARELSRFGEEPDPRRRAEMLDEGLPLLRSMLTGTPVSHDGPHFRAEDVAFLPRPLGSVPFWIAGRWPNARPLRRAVAYDGAFVIGLSGGEEAAELVGRLTSLRGDLDGFDVVIDVPPDADVPSWSVDGVSWVVSRFGPYRMDLDAILARVRTGP